MPNTQTTKDATRKEEGMPCLNCHQKVKGRRKKCSWCGDLVGDCCAGHWRPFTCNQCSSSDPKKRKPRWEQWKLWKVTFTVDYQFQGRTEEEAFEIALGQLVHDLKYKQAPLEARFEVVKGEERIGGRTK